MNTGPRGQKPRKELPPDYTWGDAPAGVPVVLWDYAAQPLWAQVLPARSAILMMERDTHRLRRIAEGSTLWERAGTLPDEIATDPTGIVMASGAHLAELDPATGEPRWRQRPGGPVSGLVLDTERAYAATNGPLFALAREDGRLRWRTPCSPESELYPLPDAGLLLIDEPETEALVALSAAGGERRWEFSAGGEPLVPGPIAAGTLALSAHGAGAAGLDAGTGEVRWRLETGRSFEAAARRTGDVFLFTDGSILAVDPLDGRVLWNRTMAEDREQVFTLWTPGDFLLAETWDGRLLSLEPDGGALRWERRVGQVHGVASGGGALYLRTHTEAEAGGWAVHCLDVTTGASRWEMRSRRMVQDLTWIDDTLVVELKNRVVAMCASRSVS